MKSTTGSLTARDVARLGRVCGRLDALRHSDACALAMIDTPLWRGWPEPTRRLWELAYHVAQSESAPGPRPSSAGPMRTRRRSSGSFVAVGPPPRRRL